MAPNWKPQLWHLLGRSWESLVAWMGTTTPGVVVSILILVAVLAWSTLSSARTSGKTGLDALMEGLRHSVGPMVISVVLTVVAWSGLLFVFIAKTIYKDHQDLTSENDGLRNQNRNLVEENNSIATERDEWKRKAEKAPEFIYRTVTAVNESPQLADQRAAIQKRLGEFMDQGVALRGEWAQRLGKPAEIQNQSAISVREWHTKVADYLRTIPGGEVYIRKFQNPPTGLHGLPEGMNVSLSGYWTMLEADLDRLGQLISDKTLGRP